MVGTKGSKSANWSKSHKTYLSSDRSLQLDFVKLESLVIVDQNATVNTFPGLVHTARHTMGVGLTRRRCANLPGKLGWRQATTVGSATGVKS